MSTSSSTSSVLPPMSPRSVARLSRVNSSSGAISSRSLQSFRTVPLPGLLPGTSIGILASGALDKRRDGAVRGGWAKRLFILSTRSLHYYRKNEEYELFGKERGQSPLSDIGLARIVPPEDAPYGSVEVGMSTAFIAVISRKKSLLMFLRADTLDIATAWVNTINRAIQVAQTIHFSPKWPIEVIQKFTSAASGNFDEGVMGDEPVLADIADAPQAPRVLVVSMIAAGLSPSLARERVIKRQLDLDTEVELGAFRPKDSCVIVLNDGEEIHVTHQMLGANVEAMLKDERELILSTPPRPRALNPSVVTVTKVHAYVRCTPAPPVIPLTPQNSGLITTTQPPPSAFSVAFPGGLGGLFLLSCVVAFWFAYPFEGLMKITIVVGFILAVSQVSQFVISAASSTGKGASVKVASVPASNLNAGKRPGEQDLVYHFRITAVEVVEKEQEIVPMSPSTEEETSENADDAASAISGGPIPFSSRFIAAEKGDEDKGRQRYENTLQWRQENEIDSILIRPHRTFETIKKYYPQYFHGRSKKGLPVYYEQPGKIDLNGLKREGLSIDDLLKHYMYITEYLWRVIEPDDAGRSVTVLDVSGIGMSDLGGEVLDFIKRASAFTGAHYPERSSMIFIINIPGWFNMIWRMIKPLIDPVTREKIHMLKGSAILKELEMHIDANQIPSDLGGRGVPLGQSQEEHDLRDHVSKYLDA